MAIKYKSTQNLCFIYKSKFNAPSGLGSMSKSKIVKNVGKLNNNFGYRNHKLGMQHSQLPVFLLWGPQIKRTCTSMNKKASIRIRFRVKRVQIQNFRRRHILLYCRPNPKKFSPSHRYAPRTLEQM
jgi:hypothetical protein